MKKNILFWAVAALFTVACGKDDKPGPPEGNLRLHFDHQVDGDSLKLSEMIYTNAAGNSYRVVRLKYFISGVKLFSNGSLAFEGGLPVAINAFYEDSRELLCSKVPVGSYDSLSFSLGVVPKYNYDKAFELTNNTLDMYWPTSLGGGYHFMKFEGHWKDGDQTGGYAFHLGQNENLVTTGFGVDLQVKENETSTVDLVMNVNQWFEDPYLYDLKVEGGYTMGDTLQMGMLVSNGHNVFSLKQ